MKPPSPLFDTLTELEEGLYFYSLQALANKGPNNIKRLPISLRIILESLLRNCDGKWVHTDDIVLLCNWNAKMPRKQEIPFIVSRVILQDFTGVPLLVDLAAMRDAAVAAQADPLIIEPKVPVDLIIDHSVQVDRSGSADAFLFNLELENQRNYERYAFLKWGQQAFETFRVIPPGIGIVHQINLEHLATVVTTSEKDGRQIAYPDTLVGTDSHTTMINGLGVVGWGVGGIEAEASMLGLPANLQTPEVIGLHLSGKLPEGVTATDLTLRVTELLRAEKVVGKFVEFFGEGVGNLSVADRATIGNMAPEYGATIGYFPVDDKTLEYLKFTGRPAKHIALVKKYLQAQGLYGVPQKGEIDYTAVLELDLSSITPSVAGPKRPQDRINLPHVKSTFENLLALSIEEGGYGKGNEKQAPKICIHANGFMALPLPHVTGGREEVGNATDMASWSEAEMVTNRPLTKVVIDPGYHVAEGSHINCDAVLSHGSIAIAAITSCTNTSNPSTMLAAGLLAKNAVEKGLRVNSVIKTSLAPGSRVVTDYLERAGLQSFLDTLGFQLVAYGCTTCIGNSGPLEENIEKAIKDHDLIAASVLSGNRNFEARIHSTIKANFLMSPPLVVAFAIAGRVNIDMDKEPLGYGNDGEPVFLRDIWPSNESIEKAVYQAVKPEMFQTRYKSVADENPVWNTIPSLEGPTYHWDIMSSYIQEPPYFKAFSSSKKESSLQPLTDMRALAIFGNSVTTDHISPAGGFRSNSPAGRYLLSLGIKEEDFNSYGSRRGNHHVMVRGTFANVRIRNLMAGGQEGGHTLLMPEKCPMPIFDACEIYQERGIPLIVFAGKDYGMGSSRDWAAKGPALLGVKVVVAVSFERIHRSNLIGMGILPLQFQEGSTPESLGITGHELFSLEHIQFSPGEEVSLTIKNGHHRTIPLISRLDNATEVECYRSNGILPLVLRHLLHKTA